VSARSPAPPASANSPGPWHLGNRAPKPELAGCRQTVIIGAYVLCDTQTPDGARMDMQVIQADNEITHVVLDGRFDIQGAQEVDSRFDELAKSSKALVVDLAKVSFLASLGIRTLMLSAKTLIRHGGDMAVCGANENVEKVLRTTGFNEVAGIYPDYESAARALAERLAAFSSKKA
jgi:anti-sigma B factor antagonist